MSIPNEFVWLLGVNAVIVTAEEAQAVEHSKTSGDGVLTADEPRVVYLGRAGSGATVRDRNSLNCEKR